MLTVNFMALWLQLASWRPTLIDDLVQSWRHELIILTRHDVTASVTSLLCSWLVACSFASRVPVTMIFWRCTICSSFFSFFLFFPGSESNGGKFRPFSFSVTLLTLFPLTTISPSLSLSLCYSAFCKDTIHLTTTNITLIKSALCIVHNHRSDVRRFLCPDLSVRSSRLKNSYESSKVFENVWKRKCIFQGRGTFSIISNSLKDFEIFAFAYRTYWRHVHYLSSEMLQKNWHILDFPSRSGGN